MHPREAKISEQLFSIICRLSLCVLCAFARAFMSLFESFPQTSKRMQVLLQLTHQAAVIQAGKVAPCGMQQFDVQI